MKSIARIAALFLSGLFLVLLSACGDHDLPLESPAILDAPGENDLDTAAASFPEESDSQIIRLEVCQVNENTGVLAIPVEGETGELCFVSCSEAEGGADSLVPGTIIEVRFSGEILETWPASLYQVETVTAVGQSDSLLPLYLDILDYLYEEDDGLNPDSEGLETVYYGFDLSEVHNLRDMEKTALLYLFENRHNESGNVQTLTGTFEELCEEGYIDRENLCWEDGMLITVRDEPAENGSFSFSVSKWRSGLGAVGMDDCQAKKEADGWSFEPGVFWIS